MYICIHTCSGSFFSSLVYAWPRQTRARAIGLYSEKRYKKEEKVEAEEEEE